MNIFYAPITTENLVKLDAEESRHCIKVLRLRKDDHVLLLNGKGSSFEAAIQSPDPKGCLLEIIKEQKIEHRTPRLTIALAPTKNIDRYEWFVEKATEIGIDRIIPLICRHSERKEIKAERIEKILISAMKQSGQLFLPELTPLLSFRELVGLPFEGEKLIAHCGPGDKTVLQKAIIPGHNLLILIGPEGDFDPDEVELALQKGFIPVSLGDSRLRTETAGMVACLTANLVNSR